MANAIYQNITGQTINGVAPGGQIISSDNNQALADQGFAWVGPAGSGSGANATEVAGNSGGSYDQYNFMTLKQAQRLAENAFSGMQSPMTMEQIRQRELEAQELNRQTAGAIYDPKIKGSEALGRGQISTTKGVVGQGSGFTLSTAEMTYLNNVQGEVQARTKEIVDAKANYIAQGDFAAAERADEQIALLREYENKLIMAKANYALALMSGDREQANAILDQQKFAFDRYATQATLDLNIAEFLVQLPKGQEIEVNGTVFKGMGVPDSSKAFFSGSDIVSLMKSIPMGQQQTVVDPNTGMEWNISGLSSETAGYYEATNDRGDITFIDKVTLQPVQTIRGVGKTKSTNITNVNVTSGERTDLLGRYIDSLELGKGDDGKYNSGDVAKAFQEYSIKVPGKSKEFWDAVKPYVNMNDSVIKAIAGKVEGSGSTGITLTGQGGNSITITGQ